MTAKYNAADIEVLSGLEPVKRRPGMYTDTTRPNHLVQEVVDNSVDEALAGHAKTVEVILYPGAFKVNRDVSEDGVVSHDAGHLAGESWQRGPVVLSWETAAADLAGHHSGHNVVLHEFAHKLDSLDGSANGIPPLHSSMVREQWTQVFTDAFDALRSQLEHHHPHGIDAYAATSPAEFFAVVTETFFSAPATLQHHFPAVYEQLALFYRQDPKSRLTA